MLFLLNVFGVGVSCRILYSVVYLCFSYVSCRQSITSVEEERANLSAIVYLQLCVILFGEVSSSSGCLGWAALFYCANP